MRYSLIGREIGIEIEADSEEEAIEKAEGNGIKKAFGSIFSKK